MPFQIDLWTRFESDGQAVYLRGDRPDWFVPNSSGDEILRELMVNPHSRIDIPAQLFLARLPDSPPLPYAGRSAFLTTDHLRECWFHLTNRCNQNCRHCLFSSSPKEKKELHYSRVLALADEAAALGCRVFALTGGEPLVHPDFSRIVDHLLGYENSHVLVLTNGLLLQQYAQAMSQWPPDRFHLQISLDGNPEHHDGVRGPGAYKALTNQLEWLHRHRRPFTLSMCVNVKNSADMATLVEVAHAYGGANVHYLWYFVRGRGKAGSFASPEEIFPYLIQAAERAAHLGIGVDNLESLRNQIFTPSGTIHDGPGSGWNSLAIGPDGKIYPSPALVGLPALATAISESLARAWRESPVLEKIRQATAVSLDSPFRFLLGGGDLDHSYIHDGRFLGADPYQALYEKLALWLIRRDVQPSAVSEEPGLLLKMGEVLGTCASHGGVALTHNNCLLAAAQPQSIETIKAFYQEAAVTEKPDITNPVYYPEKFISHIPPARRFRGYGCGSPVLEAGLAPGEHALDLGSGLGLECFIAAPLVGPQGRVYGVDMLETMLSRARAGAAEVAVNLGYENLEFKSGYLEDLPLESKSLDVVLSNCVINLSTHKRRTFTEIYRVLRPGGRLVIADVVCDTDPPADIKNNDLLRGECLAGALTQKDLFGLLRESGFTNVCALKRFPYRQVQGHQFYSLTYSAAKPGDGCLVQVMYPGPLAGLVTEQGGLLPAGVIRTLEISDLPGQTKDLFILDSQGAVKNQHWHAPSCCPGNSGCCSPASEPSPALSCCPPHEPIGISKSSPPDQRIVFNNVLATENRKPKTENYSKGCLLCGSPLTYLNRETAARCVYCQKTEFANALCRQGHYVCDACHSRDALQVIEHLLLTSEETDMLALLQHIRHHPAIALHGPEHHSLVPGIILAAYRNLGGPVNTEMLQTALRRGKTLMGGACAFLGACGAAAGVGVAFSLILDANPLKATERQLIKQVSLESLQASALIPGARCCQRECWQALRQAARLSRRHLALPLPAAAPLNCQQWQQNNDCLRTECPLWPG